MGATTVDFFFLATEAFGLADAFMIEDMVGFGAANEPVAAFAALRPVVSAISETAAPAMIRRFDDSLNVTWILLYFRANCWGYALVKTSRQCAT